MKNIIKLLSLVFLAVFIYSCDLEEEIISDLSADQLQNVSDVEAVVAGAYANLANSRLFTGHFQSAIMARGDLVTTYPQASLDRILWDQFTFNEQSALSENAWNALFQVVGASNTAIQVAESTISEEETKNRLVGDARFVRALAYFHLVENYGDMPIITEVINTVDLADGLNGIVRSSVSQVYDEIIIPDLEFAKEWLSPTRASGNRAQATSGTAAGYLAYIHLIRGDDQKAYDEAKFVIDNRDEFGYALEADYQALFDATRVGNSPEPMFTVAVTSAVFTFPFQDDIMGPLTGIPAPGSEFRGWGQLAPSLPVYEFFIETDYRRDVSFQSEIIDGGGNLINFTDFSSIRPDVPNVPHIAKFRRFPGTVLRPVGRESDMDYIQLRYAEMLLIAAEASNRLNGGPNAEAYDFINQLRARARGADGTSRAEPADLTQGLSQAEFEDAVLTERIYELAFEGKRWYDIKRLDLGPEVFSPSGPFENRPDFNQNRYLLLIPASQLVFNDWDQNPR